MKKSNKINERIFTSAPISGANKMVEAYNKTIAFTNGVFDILHEGHINGFVEGRLICRYSDCWGKSVMLP